MAMLEFDVRSDLGLVRDENQDSAGVFPPQASNDDNESGILFIVADGMGGHRGGKEASDIAVKTVHSEYFSNQNGGIGDRLRRAVSSANAAVKAYGDEHIECRGMGSTLTALVLHVGNAVIAHVGDSRAYRISRSTITQLTEDHSLVASWERNGWLTAEQARVHPERSLLYRALGVKDEVEVDLIEGISLEENDCVVLCSDGLSNHVNDSEIFATVAGSRPEEACGKLIALALERGGSDNVTVVTVKVIDRNGDR